MGSRQAKTRRIKANVGICTGALAVRDRAAGPELADQP